MTEREVQPLFGGCCVPKERESREVNGRTERYGLERGEVKSVTGEGSGSGKRGWARRG